MSSIAWLLMALFFGLAVGSVILVFLHHDWLTRLRNRVTGWQWTEISERARLTPDSLSGADRKRLQHLQDDLQRYKHYPGKSAREELLQRLTALRVLAYGPNPTSRYEALQELASIISALSEDLETEMESAELPYRHLVQSVLDQLYPGDPSTRTRGWEFEKLNATPPSQKQLFELLASVIFCMTAHLDRHSQAIGIKGKN